MEKDNQEQAAMELAETGGALGLEVPESMEISIDEIALPELAHLGTMELLLQACANHLYSLDRMQTAWMSAMLEAELPYFDAGGGSGGDLFSSALGNGAAAGALATLITGATGGMGAPLAALLTAAFTIWFGEPEPVEGLDDFQNSLKAALVEGKVFGEEFTSDWQKKEENWKNEYELQKQLEIVPRGLLPLEYSDYGHDIHDTMSTAEKKKYEAYMNLPRQDQQNYVAEDILAYTTQKGINTMLNVEDYDPSLKMPEIAEAGPYKLQQMRQELGLYSDEQLNSDFVHSEKKVEVTVNCNFEGVSLTVDQMDEIYDYVVRRITEETGISPFGD